MEGGNAISCCHLYLPHHLSAISPLPFPNHPYQAVNLTLSSLGNEVKLDVVVKAHIEMPMPSPHFIFSLFHHLSPNFPHQAVKLPLSSLGYEGKYDVVVKAHGGGLNAQAQAMVLGIARALVAASAANRPPLKAQGMLTRDARSVERKKQLTMAAFSMASLQCALPRVSLSQSAVASPARKPVVSAAAAMGASSSRLSASFNGLRRDSLISQSSDLSPLSSVLPSNGSRVFAMRHGRRIARLGRPADQRKALLRGLTTELLRHGRIKTTAARAKAMRKFVDHMITLAKGGSLHERRQALGFVYDKTLVHAIFSDAPERYAEREGGYTRIIRTMPRRGDNAPMCFIELV
ncbi:unnamed protein product [Closterium sp. NIES-65]|nr:unnamed protein product [Closterium sp. NIES-65]